jgi:hypothetical protein
MNASIIALAGALAYMPLVVCAEERPALSRLAWLDGPTWYAIAGSYRTQRQADAMAQRLGEPWIVQNSNICDNFTQGIWMVVAGVYDAAQAKRLALPVRGYAKECK